MSKLFPLLAAGLAALAAASAASAAVQARDAAGDATTPACTSPPPVHTYAWLHCYSPAQIRAAYGVDRLGLLGEGQTIVLVDSYGEPTGAQDLQAFHDAFFPGLPDPNFTAVYPNGAPNYKNVGNGQSGSSGAEGWAGEAALDIEWSYAIAPLAHIVLLGVPPAETEGVQGFPNLFKAISDAIDTYPAGTVFSMSFGVTEQTFGGATNQPTKKFDAVFAKGVARGDTFFASSGDEGSLGVSKQQRDSVYYGYPTDGWPASSPYVTAVGGTQLQYGWTWDPQSDVAFTPDGDYNPAYFQYTNDGAQNVVWNESWCPCATGGGPSVLYPRPAWQTGVLPGAGNHRLVPDVAWNASVNGGVLVYTSFFPQTDRVGWHVYGGTSAASPQVAALTALAVEKAGHPLGNINPAIYANPSAFTDVVPVRQGSTSIISGDLGTNRMFDYNGDGLPVTWDPVAGWPVLGGYDMTTGWGTPNPPAYVAALSH
ncbi:MAG TPA: S53 family peptidase [Gaiellaceae bacterium]|nr:S53 family peptidase [Gaiellaceae bacterium]